MKISKIVVTGGPCAGKTTALSWIQNAFTKGGIKVLFVPETATELISGGVAPWTCGSNLEYQKCQMRLQMEKEAIFEQAARTMKEEQILIVCDRGALDNKAYMTNEEYQFILGQMGLNEIELKDSYDAVFHLVTAANGSESFYTTANNQARIETVDQAIALDEKIVSSWTGHPHLRIIDNSTDFNQKMKRLLEAIHAFLGNPQEEIVDRKFLIRLPDLELLRQQGNWTRIEIVQTYLNAPEGVDKHIRRRGADGHFVYYQKTKRTLENGKLLQMERRLTAEDYIQLLGDANPNYRPLTKTRYCFTENTSYFEIDVYPFWKDIAILRTEQRPHEKAIEIPPYLTMIRDVTNEPAYKNISLAQLK